MDTNPYPISREEWREIAALQAVRDVWGFDPDDTPEYVQGVVYGVKFRFTSGGPGYVGDLFVLQGDALGEPPMTLYRDANNKLVVAY